MTDEQRLAWIERHSPAIGTSDVAWLASIARRALAAESALQTFLRDREADEGSQARRDVLLRDEAARMAARECKSIVDDQIVTASRPAEQYCAERLAERIAARFGLDAGTPTLSQHVAADCVEIARDVGVQAVAAGDYNAAGEIVAAIRARFGLASPASPFSEASSSALPQTSGAANFVVVDEPGG